VRSVQTFMGNDLNGDTRELGSASIAAYRWSRH
jgi:hypothetical protein